MVPLPGKAIGLRRRGFTLIELLVVIAIIAILIGLLLPAVQKVREAAARSRCQNNMKQLGLALHGYHDVNNGLPPGGASDAAPLGQAPVNSGGWGSAWTVFILPYIEQGPLFQRMIFQGSSGWGGNPSGLNNANAASNVVVPTFVCPSSPIPVQVPGPPPGNVGPHGSNHYVGVSGAVPGLIPGFNETRFNTPGGAAGCCSGGIVSGGGVMIPGGRLTLVGITDGTSNTMVLGEQNNWLFTENGSQVRWGAGLLHGWMIGYHRPIGISPPALGNGGDLRTFQMTTIRYRINQNRGWPNAPGNCGSVGVCDNMGTNIPLNSAHSGGINVAMGDGSVRFLRDSLPLNVLAQLATRDDGIPFNADF